MSQIILDVKFTHVKQATFVAISTQHGAVSQRQGDGRQVVSEGVGWNLHTLLDNSRASVVSNDETHEIPCDEIDLRA